MERSPMKYRDWDLSEYLGMWSASGPDYDASYEGEEDGWVGNGQCVTGRSREEVCQQIDEFIEEQEPTQ